MGHYRRPSNVPFPSVWSQFKGKREFEGRIPEFWIQDLPDDRHNDVLEYLKSNYIHEAPLCKYTGAPRDPEFLKDFDKSYSKILRQNLCLICLTRKPGVSKPVIVGVHILSMTEKDEDEKKDKSNKRWEFLKYITSYKDPFRTFGVTEYLSGAGLSVLPEYRGQNIALELLKCDLIMMKALGIKLTITLFTAEKAQILAERAGFKDFVSLEYEEVFKVRPDLEMPGISEEIKYCRFMYKLVE